MYPFFIEVHDGKLEKKSPMLINIDNIEVAYEYNGKMFITTQNGDAWCVEESLDNIKTLLKDAGCQIEKGDPRLDTSKPLTMEDLKNMLGQPVWNSNTGKWGLVRNYIEAGADGVDVAFYLDAADNNTPVTENDLIAKPLYRMRTQ